MIQQDELRIGNHVYWNPHFSHSNINARLHVEIAALLPNKAGYIRSHLEYRVEPFEDDLIAKEFPFASYEELEPIPIDENFLKTRKEKIEYPSWIKYIHELQNWFYWSNEKRELKTEI